MKICLRYDNGPCKCDAVAGLFGYSICAFIVLANNINFYFVRF